MKLYHIDRFGHLKSGELISLVKDFNTNKLKDRTYYEKGLSSHGIHYFTSDWSNKDYLLDAIFEYERLINYPEKLSRYQSFFCFDEYGVIDFIKEKDLEDNFYKIYEIDVDDKRVEKHNMLLIRGWSHQSAIRYARLYWENKSDVYNKDAKIVDEYLVELPVVIGREVKINELEKIIQERKN